MSHPYKMRNIKNYIIPVLLSILILGVVGIYAGVTISNSPSSYLQADNLTINSSGISNNNNPFNFYNPVSIINNNFSTPALTLTNNGGQGIYMINYANKTPNVYGFMSYSQGDNSSGYYGEVAPYVNSNAVSSRIELRANGTGIEPNVPVGLDLAQYGKGHVFRLWSIANSTDNRAGQDFNLSCYDQTPFWLMNQGVTKNYFMEVQNQVATTYPIFYLVHSNSAGASGDLLKLEVGSGNTAKVLNVLSSSNSNAELHTLSTNSGEAITEEYNGLTSGIGRYAYSTTAHSGNLMDFRVTNGGASGNNLRLLNDGSGSPIQLVVNGSSKTCDVNHEGGIIYSSDKHFYGCNSTTWIQLG